MTGHTEKKINLAVNASCSHSNIWLFMCLAVFVSHHHHTFHYYHLNNLMETTVWRQTAKAV